MPQLGGVALVVLDVAEGDGPRRARLLARGQDVAVRTDRFSSRAWSLPATMRWMHIVHFSITPSCRTVTSGLSWTSSGSGHSQLYQLNRRTWYGQLLPQ